MVVEKSKIVERSKKLGLKLPQLQLLIAQDGFMARLARLKEGKLFVWKGGSLVLRAYRHLQKPRFTTDVDLLMKKILSTPLSHPLYFIPRSFLGYGKYYLYKRGTSVNSLHLCRAWR